MAELAHVKNNGVPVNTVFSDVLAFHRAMDIYIGSYPRAPDLLWEAGSAKIIRERFARWAKESIESTRLHPPSHPTRKSFVLVVEEFGEWLHSLQSTDTKLVANETVDLIYVLIGFAISHGVDLSPVWDAIQEANMRKVGGPKRSDGKQQKPPDWRPADLNPLDLAIK